MSELISSYLPTAILIVGILAFLVSAITEVTKGLPWLNTIPTDAQVIVLSIVLTLVAFFAYIAYMSIVVTWYYIVGAVICGFFVAFVAMYGWTKLTELWSRFQNPDSD